MNVKNIQSSLDNEPNKDFQDQLKTELRSLYHGILEDIPKIFPELHKTTQIGVIWGNGPRETTVVILRKRPSNVPKESDRISHNTEPYEDWCTALQERAEKIKAKFGVEIQIASVVSPIRYEILFG